MKVIIIGAGPVGCLLAEGLRRLSFDVVVYERNDDPRHARPRRGHSFNLTLSRRGLQAVDPELCERLYAHGVRLCRRVIHRLDGGVLSQPYGISDGHHLLSIPRDVLHVSLVERAERSGARLRFRHECIRVDAARASATFVAGGVITEDTGDIVAGCDGANSVVRQEMAQGGGLQVSQKHIDLGYVELGMPTGPSGDRGRANAGRAAGPTDPHDGFHVWPRGDFMLVAQPNIDGTCTATLFLPFTSADVTKPAFSRLDTPDRVADFFGRFFPDVLPLLPLLATEFHAAPPASLKTVKCDSFHHGRAVLLGDAAHAMLPFYGQGINCGFEDIRVFLDLLGRTRGRPLTGAGPRDAIREALVSFTAARKGPCDAIADLSQTNLHELAAHTADTRFHSRSRLEMELFRRHPTMFEPLYCGVAFSDLPYDEVISRYYRGRHRLDELCEAHDPEADQVHIIESFAASPPVDRTPTWQPDSGLELSASKQKELLDLTVNRLLRYHRDLAAGRYPASYVHDSFRVSDYEEGKRLCAGLREDEVPRVGADPAELLGEIFDRAVAAGTVHPHPGFMAHVPSGGLLQAAVGGFIAKALNRFPGVWVAAPGLVQLECNVLRWFCSLLGYDRRAFGYLTTSGSIANMLGLMCARRQGGEGVSPGSVTIYASDQAHFSVWKAARLVGIPPGSGRVINTGPDYRMDINALVCAIESDRARGLRPTCVVATAGATNTGAIDDLDGLSAVCERMRIWLHVDACFGGFFRITARGRAALRGIENADSIAVDAHKSLFLPHGNSALLVKNRTHLLATFETPGAAYLPGTPLDPDLIDFCDCGPELSREVRGLATWLPLKMHGIRAFERCLDERLDLAAHLAAELGTISSIELIRRHPIHLPVVVFKARAAHGIDESRLNRRLCELVCSRGNVYITTTVLPDCGSVLRACILNHRTDRATVGQLVADVRSSVGVLRTEWPGALQETRNRRAGLDESGGATLDPAWGPDADQR
jgi:glutamate/tyrosine decarboxylase-like PLP-dependent enzyme/2-polyprenyl-6-methoxyphenol hydroxylase-like FAD-dependent oxidoreductase